MPYKDPAMNAICVKRWRERNPERVKEMNRKYLRRNPWINSENCARKRFPKAPYNRKKVMLVYKEMRLRNDAAGYEKYHVDHIIPRSKGGLHHEDNVQILLKEDNLAKGDSEHYMDDKL